MKQFQALLYKEWRDQRTLLGGMYVLCVLLVVAARLVAGTRFNSHFREETILQACFASVVVVLAVESVVRDRQSRADESLARLPIRTVPGWASKIVFVALAACATLAGLVLLESAILLAEGHPLLDGLLTMIQPVWWCAIAAIAAACHTCARVLRRSLPAALLGIALVAGVPFAASELPVGRMQEIVDIVLASWTAAALALLLCAAFLLGSLLAYRVRRLDPIGWRRAGGALLGVALVLGPAFANSVRLGEWAFDILPFSKSAEVRNISLSPDGKFLALNVSQSWTPRRDWLPLTGSRTGSNCRVRFEVWILDPSTGAVKEIDDRFRAFPMDNPWDAEGHLVTVSTPGAFGDGDYTAERIDPETATVLSSHPESELDSRDYRYGFDRWFEESKDDEQRELLWQGSTVRLRLPREARVLPSPEPGIVFHESGNTLVRHDLADDSTRVLAELHDLRSALLRVSPDGRYLLLGEGRRGRILDARDGRVVLELPENSGLPEWSRIPGRIGLFCTQRSKYVDWQVLLEDGSLMRLPTHEWNTSEFGRDRLVYHSRGWIECKNLDGSERRVLYGPRP